MGESRHHRHGRGAGSNPRNRYSAHATSPFDDGWGAAAPTSLRTTVGIDRARRAISYNDSPDIPFDRSVNPYRGCEHGCVYCYARPTHAWLDLSPGLDFESRLFARPGLPELLRDELAAPDYRPAPLAIGAITDAYQPIERHHAITRRVVEILAAARHPTLLITKSAMVERDIDVLSDMAADGLLEVAISLTTLAPGIARTLEPRAASPRRRLQTIAALADAGIPVRVMLAPVIPVLTEAEIESLLTAARDAGARCASYVLLRLPLEVADLFRDWLRTHHPDAAQRVMRHVRDTRGGHDNDARFGHRMRGRGPYADLIAQRFALAGKRLGFESPTALRSDLFVPPQRHGQIPLFTP
ncbi:MAG: PA0069 family radical SAM protein [Gammaproteobacteria bacterium]|nr:PA0069 family radical SAM protein [Gammaproteobacteria bacterium]